MITLKLLLAAGEASGVLLLLISISLKANPLVLLQATCLQVSGGGAAWSRSTCLPSRYIVLESILDGASESFRFFHDRGLMDLLEVGKLRGHRLRVGIGQHGLRHWIGLLV